MIREIDLVICDVDGCLAAEHGGNFDLPKLRLLADYNRRALAAGDLPPLTVCTGRPQPFAEAMCRLLGNDAVPCIAEMGVWLYHPGTNHYEMDPAILPVHLDAIHAAARRLDEEFRSRGVTHQPGKAAAVTLFHPEPDVLKQIVPRVREIIAENDWPLRTSMTWNYINCDLLHVSKGSGLRRFFEQSDFDPLRTAGIGDTTSDLAMAELLGWFASPANASPGIRDHAQYISPHAEVAGVIDIVEEIVGRPLSDAGN